MKNYTDKFNEHGVYGQLDENNNVTCLCASEGVPVTKLDANIYPVNSNLSAKYEHAQGITITIDNGNKIGIAIES